MSNGHGSSRRQAYGRRMKDLRTRRDDEAPDVDLDGPDEWTSRARPGTTTRPCIRPSLDLDQADRSARTTLMAVFQGARLRTAALPAGPADAPRHARQSRAATGRPPAADRASSWRAILAGTMLGLVYLTQTLGSNATSSEIDDLAAEREDLARQLRNLAVAVEIVCRRRGQLGPARPRARVSSSWATPIVLSAP